MYSAEIQRGRDQSKVPVDSRGKPCSPQQGPYLGEVRHSRGRRRCLLGDRESSENRVFLSISVRLGAVLELPCPGPRLLDLFRCRFISYCMKERGFTGFDFKDAEGEVRQLVQQLLKL